jgi:hypothetical protein
MDVNNITEAEFDVITGGHDFEAYIESPVGIENSLKDKPTFDAKCIHSISDSNKYKREHMYEVRCIIEQAASEGYDSIGDINRYVQLTTSELKSMIDLGFTMKPVGKLDYDILW